MTPADREAQPAPIRALPRDVAERIAAGEVIERPASVVRELLDNALDAGATEVAVDVRGGGLDLIRVADDGHGIPADQVELAFQRHATSKIRSVEDMARLHTLGFRGEALASIAAVAEVTLLTATQDAAGPGSQVVLRAGRVERHGAAARRRGTSVAVRHLFHTVPARLKFLQAGRNESLLIGQLVRRYALAHPAVRFTLALDDGRVSFRSSGSGRVEEALAEVYGASVAASLLPLPPVEAAGATIRGWLGGHGATRPGRQHLTLIVNGRWAASRGLLAALEAAYRPLLPRGRHPVAVLFLDVPPEDLDANIHPAKSEVKLLRERDLADALGRAVRDTLARTPSRPSLAADFALGAGATQPGLPTAAARHRLAEAPPGWGEAEVPVSVADLRVVAQVRDTLILAEARTGLFLVDQHRAHERVVYETLRAREAGAAEGGGAGAQALLEPLVLELKAHQAARLAERLADLERLGFSAERFGGQHYLVRAAPTLPGPALDADALRDLLQVAASEEEGWRERLLAQLACRAALRRGRALSLDEMRELLASLAATPTPAVCPHGSPLILEFSARFLERQFNW